MKKLNNRPRIHHAVFLLAGILAIGGSSLVAAQEVQNAHDRLANALDQQSQSLKTAAVYQLVSTADVPEIKQYIREAAGIANGNDRVMALAILYQRFGEFSPVDAIVHLLSSGLPDRDRYLAIVYETWARQDLEAAIGSLDRLEGPSRASAAIGILSAFGDRDPAYQEELARRLKLLPPEGAPVPQPARESTPRSYSEAWQEALALDDDEHRAAELRQIASSWAREDPGSALRQIQSLDDPAEVRRYTAEVVYHGVEADPWLSLENLAALDDPNARLMILEEAVSQIPAGEIDDALAFALELKNQSLRRTAVGIVVRRWAAIDVRAAADWYAGLENKRQFSGARLAIARAYVTRDAEEALQWAAETEGIGGSIWLDMMTVMSQLDPGGAIEYLSSLPASPEVDKGVQRVLLTLSRTDPETAAQLTESLPENRIRKDIAQKASYNWADTDSKAALEWVLTQPESVQLAALPLLGSRLVKVDLPLATDFPIDRLPEPVRGKWVSSIIVGYARIDPVAAWVWLQPLYDQLQFPFWSSQAARELSRQDPLMVIDRIGELEDHESYFSALRAVMRSWGESNGQQAAQWLMRNYSDSDRYLLVQTLASSWYTVQPSDAELWVLALTEARERDYGLFGIYVQFEPLSEDAADYYEAIESVEVRESAVQYSIIHLLNLDYLQAQVLLDSLDLKPDFQEEMQTLIDNRKSKTDWRN